MGKNNQKINREEKKASQQGMIPKKWEKFRTWADHISPLIGIASFMVSVLSLIVSIGIGNTANEIAERNQNLQYTITVPDQISAVAHNAENASLFTIEGVQIESSKEDASGEYSDMFLATVRDDVHITYLDNIDQENYSLIESNGRLFAIQTSGDGMELFFSPGYETTVKTINDQVNAFHLIYKGYNDTYSIYTVVYTYSGINQEFASEISLGKTKEYRLNIYIFDENTIYDDMKLNQVANDLVIYENTERNYSYGYTSQEVFDEIMDERERVYNQLVNAH